MRKEDFEKALMSTIVDYISDQIILRYMQASKKAVVLFTGALIGYKEAVVSLNELKEKGWELTAILSKSAADVITEDKIKADIDPKAIYVEGAPVNGRQIVNENQFVIIPTLTINTAAKLANCIFDNLITNMTSYALHSGKTIIAAVDGCCPDNKVREKLGFKVTDAYKAKLRSNLVDLQTYGINLTVDSNLAKKVEEAFSASFEFSAPEGAVSKFEMPFDLSKSALDQIVSSIDMPVLAGMMPAMTNTHKTSEDAAMQIMEEKPEIHTEVQSSSIHLDKNVLGRIDVAKNAKYKTIVVNANTLITGLAADEADKRGITIVRE